MEGRFYEYMQQQVEEKLEEKISREDAKTMMFMVFFSKNGFYYQSDAKLKRLFAQIYPQIYTVIKALKEKKHSYLACLLQAIESEIVLHRCCKRIYEETEQEVPFFTIHDSIITVAGQEDYVKHIMIEELTNCTGVQPHLKYEYWSEKKIDLKNLDEIQD